MVSYAERPWTKLYHKNTPKTIDYPEICLHDFLRQTAQRAPDNIALITSARLPLVGRVAARMNYRDLDRQSDALAAALVEMGLKVGDRVVLLMPNTAAFVVSFYGVLKAGGAVAAGNPTYPPARLQQQVKDCGAKFLIATSLFYKGFKSIQAQTDVTKVIVTNVKEYLPSLARVLFTLAREKKDGHYLESLADGDEWLPDVLTRFDGKKPNVSVTPDDVCLFQYTGGTTGISKAAVSTHRALVANVLQQDAFLSVDHKPGEEDIFLGAIPFFHVFGMVSVVSVAIMKGSSIVIVPNARDLDDVVDCIATYKPTLFHGVPALYNGINNHAKVLSGEKSIRSVQLCVSGSAPLPPSVKVEFERLSGGKLLEGFGMSEAPTATHVNPIYGENRLGSVGLPLPDMDMRIVDLDTGEHDVPVGEVGELLMSGPQVMVGYHNMPDESAYVLREIDGKRWLVTGDIAKMDEDGYFYIVDRKKDMALIGGYNVYPNNIEKVIKEHPGVLEVGVAAIPNADKAGMESLKAWVVVKPGETVTEEELVALCKKHLPPHEVPRRYAFVAEIPKTAVGKTLRRELVRSEIENQSK